MSGAEQRALEFLRRAERLVRAAAVELARSEGIAEDDEAGHAAFRFTEVESAIERAIDDVEAAG